IRLARASGIGKTARHRFQWRGEGSRMVSISLPDVRDDPAEVRCPVPLDEADGTNFGRLTLPSRVLVPFPRNSNAGLPHLNEPVRQFVWAAVHPSSETRSILRIHYRRDAPASRRKCVPPTSGNPRSTAPSSRYSDGTHRTGRTAVQTVCPTEFRVSM